MIQFSDNGKVRLLPNVIFGEFFYSSSKSVVAASLKPRMPNHGPQKWVDKAHSFRKFCYKAGLIFTINLIVGAMNKMFHIVL